MTMLLRRGYYQEYKGVFFKNIIIPNIFTAYSKASRYMKLKLIELQGEIDKFTITVSDFNIPLSVISRTGVQKIRNDIKKRTILSTNC